MRGQRLYTTDDRSGQQNRGNNQDCQHQNSTNHSGQSSAAPKASPQFSVTWIDRNSDDDSPDNQREKGAQD